MILSPAPAAIVAVANPSIEQVVVARPGPNALLIWNAQYAIADLVRRKVDKATALREIRSAAAKAMLRGSATLSGAKTITLRVLYPHAPEFNPQYNVETVSSVERLMTLQTDAASLKKFGRLWSAALSAGKQPPGLHVLLTGSLPPAFGQ